MLNKDDFMFVLPTQSLYSIYVAMLDLHNDTYSVATVVISVKISNNSIHISS